MSKIMERLRRDSVDPDTLGESLGAVETALPLARREVETATASREALLLAGTDEQILAADAKISLARIAVERLEALQKDLSGRIAAAKRAALQAEIDAIEARAAGFAVTFPGRYDVLAAPLVALMEERDAIDNECRRVNDLIRSSDLPIVARPHVAPLDERTNALRNVPGATSFETLTSIRPGKRQPGWGAGRASFAQAGIKI
ncbi:MAG: hypothetical protein LCH80_01265 [Proteobacteria bacterium]|nr:hypothetical protein [Pseudomonadota bacterium]